MNEFLKKAKDVFIIFGKHMRIFLVLAFLSVASLSITAFLVNMPINYSTDDLSINKEYLINARSLKIHKLDCSAIDKMSEKNKRIINDSITNLTSKGYIICNKCHAGIKRKNELAVNILNNKVNNVYPQNSITHIDYQNNKIICNGEVFTRVYRYVGNKEE